MTANISRRRLIESSIVGTAALSARLLRAPVAASAFIPLQTECRDLYVAVI